LTPLREKIIAIWQALCRKSFWALDEEESFSWVVSLQSYLLLLFHFSHFFRPGSQRKAKLGSYYKSQMQVFCLKVLEAAREGTRILYFPSNH
jgi:hypothetical protein